MDRVDLAHTQWEAEPTVAGPRPQGDGLGEPSLGVSGIACVGHRDCVL